MNIYVVSTERFGDLNLGADSIREARRMAWERFRAGPRSVRRWHPPRPLCDRCESRPCCCR